MKKNNAAKATTNSSTHYISEQGQQNLQTLEATLTTKPHRGVCGSAYLESLANSAHKKVGELKRKPLSRNISEAFRVDILATIAGKEERFIPGEPIRVEDIMGESYLDLEGALSKLIDLDANWSKATQSFICTSTSPYASTRFKFELGLDDVLDYDEFGFITTPFSMSIATELPKICHLQSDVIFSMIPCFATQNTDHSWSLRISNPETSNTEAIPALFCKAHWGGSNANTMGASCVEIDYLKQSGQIIDFERCVSKGGKEGCDYYLLPMWVLEDDGSINEVDLKAYVEKCTRITKSVAEEQRGKFRAKIALLEDAIGMDESDAKTKQEIDTQLTGLIKKCEEAEVAKLSFVTAPKIRLRKTVMPSKELSLRMDYETLLKKVTAISNRTTPSTYLMKKQQQVGAWLDCAPRYASLLKDVAHLNGSIKITGCKAVIKMPSSTVPGKFVKIKGIFTATQFALVRKQIDELLELEEINFVAFYSKTKSDFRQLMEHADEWHILAKK